MPRLTVRAYVSALPALLKQQAKDDAYKVYITEALRFISENTAKYTGGGYIKVKYTDIINPRPEEKRTRTEIIDQMKLRLQQIGGE